MLLYKLIRILEDLLPVLIPACVILGAIGIGCLARLNISRIDRERAGAAPLCSWDYSASEWQRYAKLYNLSKAPVGSAKITITPLDIWITDNQRAIRKELDNARKCVTSCRFENNELEFRVRGVSYSVKGGAIYSCDDFRLPVPVGKERQVAEVVKSFREQIAKNSNKIAGLTRDGDFTGLMENPSG